MTTCSQDSYYNTGVFPTSCGLLGASYSNCGKDSNSSCCPLGYYHKDEDNTITNTGCHYDGDLPGGQFKCYPVNPLMDNDTTIACCMNNVTDPNGICDINYCQGSSSCQAYMDLYCTNPSFINSATCLQYCNSDDAQSRGACDAAITSYCTNPTHAISNLCSCASPRTDLYYKGIEDITPSIPVNCYSKCGSNANAIKVSTNIPCENLTFCLISDIDISTVQSQIKGGITISNNCNSNNDTTTNITNGSTCTTSSSCMSNYCNSSTKVCEDKPFYHKGIFYIILGGSMLFLLIIIIILIMKSKGNNDDDDNTPIMYDDPNSTYDIPIDTSSISNTA